MRLTSPFRAAFTLLALGAALCAQPQATKPAAPVRSKEAVTLAGPRELVLPVLGLSEENVAMIRADLLALADEVFLCPACGFEQEGEGTCPKDKAALEPQSRALFSAVEPSTAEKTIALRMDARHHVRLSRVEAALTRRAVRVDDEHLVLDGRSTLVVRTALAGDPAALEKVLLEAKLFEEAKAERERDTDQILVHVRAGASAPTRAKVSAILQGAQARLSDVVWGPVSPKS